jgi:FkbM family methyltransferase
MNVQQLKRNPFLRLLCAPCIGMKRWALRREEARFEAGFKRYMGMVQDPLVLQVPDYGGSFELGVQSNLVRMIVKEGSYEPDLLGFVRQYLNPGRDAIDIGANVGLFSVLLSHSLAPSSRLFAAEPSDAAHERLLRNIARNDCRNVIPYRGALGRAAAVATLHVVPGKEEYASLQPLRHVHACNLEQDRVEVTVSTLDDQVAALGLDPGFIKMDVEGAEFEVLRGAEQTLRKFHPVILSELDDRLLAAFGTRASEVVAFLESCGYTVCDARSGGRVMGGFGDCILARPKS